VHKFFFKILFAFIFLIFTIFLLNNNLLNNNLLNNKELNIAKNQILNYENEIEKYNTIINKLSKYKLGNELYHRINLTDYNIGERIRDIIYFEVMNKKVIALF